MMLGGSGSKYYAYSSSNLLRVRVSIQCENKPANLVILQDKDFNESFAAADVLKKGRGLRAVFGTPMYFLPMAGHLTVRLGHEGGGVVKG